MDDSPSSRQAMTKPLSLAAQAVMRAAAASYWDSEEDCEMASPAAIAAAVLRAAVHELYDFPSQDYLWEIADEIEAAH